MGAGAGTEAVGDGAELGVAAGAGIGAAEGGDDDGLGLGAEVGGVGIDGGMEGAGATAGGARPLRSTRTTTKSFSFARQLASLPLMKKKGPERLNVKTVLPSSNFWTYDDALHESYALRSTSSTESVSLGYTNKSWSPI